MEIFDAAWMYAAVRMSAPLAVTAMGEVISQRAGVINIGLEGMMLLGAFFGVYAVILTGSVALGVLAAVLAGVVMAVIMALLSVQGGGDQIVVGLGIMLLGIGLTTFLFQEMATTGNPFVIDRMRPYPIPLLDEIPLIGPVLFSHTVLVYLAYVTVPVTWFVIFRTRVGIILRAAGEVPAAVDGNGVNVYVVRWIATICAGAAAGFGGAILSIAQVGLFVEHMTAGRGFLVLAAVFFGRWRPLLAAGGCLLFGTTYALQLRLQAAAFVPQEVFVVVAVVVVATASWVALRRRSASAALLMATAVLGSAAALAWMRAAQPRWVVPSEFWLMVPFIVSLVVLAGFVGRAEMPRTLALPYSRPR